MNAGTVPTDRQLLNQSFLYSSFKFISHLTPRFTVPAFETGNVRVNHSEINISSTFT